MFFIISLLSCHHGFKFDLLLSELLDLLDVLFNRNLLYIQHFPKRFLVFLEFVGSGFYSFGLVIPLFLQHLDVPLEVVSVELKLVLNRNVLTDVSFVLLNLLLHHVEVL